MFSSHQRIVSAAVLTVCLGISACSAPEGAENTLTAGVPDTARDPESTHLGQADHSIKTTRPEAPAQLHVSNIRCGSHPGFDRVVFDLSGTGSPGWFTDHIDTASQMGSGKPISTSSPALLNVYIDGTIYPHETDEPAAKARTEGTGSINEVISAGTFEGRSQFVIGLKAPVSYSVTLLEEPKRLVIDFVTS